MVLICLVNFHRIFRNKYKNDKILLHAECNQDMDIAVATNPAFKRAFNPSLNRNIMLRILTTDYVDSINTKMAIAPFHKKRNPSRLCTIANLAVNLTT